MPRTEMHFSGSSATNMRFSGKSLGVAFQADASREILRPKEGLRMTVVELISNTEVRKTHQIFGNFESRHLYSRNGTTFGIQRAHRPPKIDFIFFLTNFPKSHSTENVVS